MSFFQNLDTSLFLWVNQTIANPVFDVLFPAITDLHFTAGFRFVFLPIVLFSLFYFYRLRGFVMIFGLALSLGIGDKLGSFAKHFWQRPRPFEAGLEMMQRSAAGGYSFPSNHAVNMFCAAFFLGAFFPKARWLFLIFAFLVAMSRVYNGVHYPFDVLMGGLLGSFMGILGSELTKRLSQKMESTAAKKKRSNV